MGAEGRQKQPAPAARAEHFPAVVARRAGEAEENAKGSEKKSSSYGFKTHAGPLQADSPGAHA